MYNMGVFKKEIFYHLEKDCVVVLAVEFKPEFCIDAVMELNSTRFYELVVAFKLLLLI